MVEKSYTCPHCGCSFKITREPKESSPVASPAALAERIREEFSSIPPWESFWVTLADVRQALDYPESGGVHGAVLRAALESCGFEVYKRKGVMVALKGSRKTAKWLPLLTIPA